MNFTEYKIAMAGFQRTKSCWAYSPAHCENALCCSPDGDHEPLIHGTVEFNGHREPIQICEDCFYQVTQETYKKNLA